jgi:hypothetical protein
MAVTGLAMTAGGHVLAHCIGHARCCQLHAESLHDSGGALWSSCSKAVFQPISDPP